MTSRKKYSKQNSSSLFFGLVLMVAGLGAGVILVSQPQLLNQKAEGIDYSCTITNCDSACANLGGRCSGTKPNCRCILPKYTDITYDMGYYGYGYSCSGVCKSYIGERYPLYSEDTREVQSANCIGVGTDFKASNSKIYTGNNVTHECGYRSANCRTIVKSLGDIVCDGQSRTLEQTYCKCRLYF